MSKIRINYSSRQQKILAVWVALGAAMLLIVVWALGADTKFYIIGPVAYLGAMLTGRSRLVLTPQACVVKGIRPGTYHWSEVRDTSARAQKDSRIAVLTMRNGKEHTLAVPFDGARFPDPEFDSTFHTLTTHWHLHRGWSDTPEPTHP
ncbi:hypothetical protein [Embleya sp. NBC_00896]|uniref:hypothetical protein n=1 Tax=Embleya sp. NBC_00896 TaxID=2975961 RepID=UPI003864EA44|nr:hypothetical protein OG928_32650 [Embleya sp. NBC_00896]